MAREERQHAPLHLPVDVADVIARVVDLGGVLDAAFVQDAGQLARPADKPVLRAAIERDRRQRAQLRNVLIDGGEDANVSQSPVVTELEYMLPA